MNTESKYVTGNKLIPLMDIWPKIADILDISSFSPIYLTETAFRELNITLYSDEENTGLWLPVSGGQDYVTEVLEDLGRSDPAHDFANGKGIGNCDGWDSYRITRHAFGQVLCYARDIAKREPELHCGHESKVEGATTRGDYPAELRAAIEAFEAVHDDPAALRRRTPKGALSEWLDQHKPELTKGARERIATVANWQPAGGAPKTPGA